MFAFIAGGAVLGVWLGYMRSHVVSLLPAMLVLAAATVALFGWTKGSLAPFVAALVAMQVGYCIGLLAPHRRPASITG